MNRTRLAVQMCNTGLSMLELARVLRCTTNIAGGQELAQALYEAAQQLSRVTDELEKKATELH